MKPVSNSLCTSAFAASTFSSNIFWSFYFPGFALGFICSLCSMISLLTPMRTEVDHTNMSLFLSRNTNNFACSCGPISVPRHTTLSGTVGSKGTFLNSPSTSMAFLYSTGAYAFRGQIGCWSCSSSSCKKCKFLWPGVKPCSMFLAPFWLSKTDITPKVAGILRQRYPECTTASKVLRRPLRKMAL
jgi:hypothetical protein